MSSAARQSPKAIEKMTQFGLGVNETIGSSVAWDSATIHRLFEYSDWANGKVLANAETLDDKILDRRFDMGRGSIRKNLLHMLDAEQWWLTNWTISPHPFPQTPVTTSIAELVDRWKIIAAARNEYLAGVDETESQREVEVTVGGPPTRFKVVESAAQLTMHGTHHRAQVVNLFRQVGSPIDNIDLLYALVDLSRTP